MHRGGGHQHLRLLRGTACACGARAHVAVRLQPDPARTRAVDGTRLSSSAAANPWARRGLWIRNLGLLLLLFVAYQLWGTSLGQARSQDRLTRTFNESIEAGPEPGSETASLPMAVTGDAVAILDIPKIGVRQAVVEGTSVSVLRKGPGHYPGTARPGEGGNVAIAGHRTTYGAPFGRLDELVAGDVVRLMTHRGRLRYEIAETKVVSPSDTRVLASTVEDRLTLTTCHPRFSANRRLIVVARLAPGDDDVAEPAKRSIPVDQAAVRGGQKSDEAVGLSGRRSAVLPTVFWAVLVVAAGRATWLLARRWAPWPAYLLGAPWVGVLILQLFSSVDQVLPAGY